MVSKHRNLVTKMKRKFGRLHKSQEDENEMYQEEIIQREEEDDTGVETQGLDENANQGDSWVGTIKVRLPLYFLK